MADPIPLDEQDKSFLEKLVGAMEKVTTPDPDKPPVEVGDNATPRYLSISDAVAERVAKDAERAAETPEQKQEREAREAEEAKPKESAPAETLEQKSEREKKEAQAAAAVIKKPERRKLEDLKVQVSDINRIEAESEATLAEEFKFKPEDEDYVKTLDADQIEELNFCKFAEQHGKPGIIAQTLDYYRKVDEWVAKNPESKPDSEEFKAFADATRPKWNRIERRKLERQSIKEETEVEVRKSVAPILKQSTNAIRETRLRPLIDELLTGVEATLVEPAELLPTGMTAIPKEVGETIRSSGYEDAMKKFPVEAPIVQGTLNASRAWIDLATGNATFDPNDKIHDWIVRFVAAEGNRFKNFPPEQRVRGGKEFLPWGDYRNMERTKPEDIAKYWTFSDDMILDLLAVKGIMAANEHKKQLEDAGWSRKAAEKPPEHGTNNETQNTEAPSPKATQRALPGAATVPVNKDETQQFLSKLIPGA